MTLDDLRTMRSPAQIFGGSNRFVVTNGTFRGEPTLFLEPIPDTVAREPGTQEDAPADQSLLTPGSVAVVLGHPGTTEVLAYFLHRAALDAEHAIPSTIQARCQAWLDRVTEGDPTDTEERIARFVEESLELAQSLGLERNAAMQLVHYVFDRPPGEPVQEFGGMFTTAAVLAQHTGHDLLACGEAELARVWDPAVIEKIRGKRSRRHGRGPLPGTVEADLVPCTELAPGCCSAASPCEHQKRDPRSICAICQEAARG